MPLTNSFRFNFSFLILPDVISNNTPVFFYRIFKIINKVIKVNYRLDLPLKIKIHPVYYIAILKLVYRNYELPVYK